MTMSQRAKKEEKMIYLTALMKNNSGADGFISKRKYPLKKKTFIKFRNTYKEFIQVFKVNNALFLRYEF